jgi:hypothetical protein
MIGRMDENAQDPHKAALAADVAKRIPDARPEPLAQSAAENTDPDAELATAANVGVVGDNDSDPPATGLRDVAELAGAVLRKATEAESRSIDDRKS